MTIMGYQVGVFPPAITEPIECAYQVAHNFILTHARAWHSYDKEFRTEQNGGLLYVPNVGDNIYTLL